MTAMIGTIFIPVFSTNLPMLLAGNFLNGIPWGGQWRVDRDLWLMISVPNLDDCVCCGNLSDGTSSSSDIFRQHLLGYG